jgi:hypothetical protein
MTYTIHKSDGTVLTTIEEGTVNTGACSIALVGRRTAGYGVPVAESLVKLLENNASNTAPSNPLIGQLWFDKGTLAVKLYNGTAWSSIATFSSNGATLTGYQLALSCPDGVAPITTASKTKVTNLNADYLDGYDSAIPATPLTVVVRNSSGDVVGVKFQGQATSTVYADVAERFEASEELEIGDIVGLGGDGEIRKSRWEDGYSLGVISGNPGIRMNEDAGSDDTHPFVGYLGRVPVKVLGKVKKGDVLGMSETPGAARASPIDGGIYGFMIGRALEDKEIDDVGLVLAVIGTR